MEREYQVADPKAKVAHKIIDGQVYFNANDLALAIEERGKLAFDADFGGINGRLVRSAMNSISEMIRRMESVRRGS